MSMEWTVVRDIVTLTIAATTATIALLTFWIRVQADKRQDLWDRLEWAFEQALGPSQEQQIVGIATLLALTRERVKKPVDIRTIEAINSAFRKHFNREDTGGKSG